MPEIESNKQCYFLPKLTKEKGDFHPQFLSHTVFNSTEIIGDKQKRKKL
jgi:hypothetical protein